MLSLYLEGIINGGCGETHANYLLAILNIPGVCKKSLKDREREVGRKLVEYAKESCKNALEEEVELWVLENVLRKAKFIECAQC